MTQNYGPWSTAINTGNNPQLSTFWKRRLTMLSRIRHKRPNISRREILDLVALCLVVTSIPTLQGKADSIRQPEKKTVQKPDPGRIYVELFLKATDPSDPNTRFIGIVAIDPGTGKFEKINIKQGGRISPDGETVVYSNDGAIWTNNLKGTSPGKILDISGSPIWSPDGKHIVVSHGELDREEDKKKTPEKPVWKVESWKTDLFGNNRIRLDVPETDFIDDWSPDGKWFVTFTDRHPPYGSGYQLYLMKPDGTEERRLTQGRGLNVSARFSPDSKKIVYTHQRGGGNIHIIDIDGKNDYTVLKDEGVTNPERAVWSPDGKQLAITLFDWQIDEKGKKFLRNGENANYRLVIMDADGKNQRALKLDTEAKIISIILFQWR